MDFKEDWTNTRDTERNRRPNLTGLAGTNKCLRKTVGTSHCGVCGECQHILSKQKTFDKQGPKSNSPESHPPADKLQIKKDRKTVTSEKIITWTNKNPEVTLCDLTKICDTCNHNCGFVLPDVFKTKIVHCFKQDLGDGFRFVRSCLKHKIRRCEESAQVKNSVLNKKKIFQSKNMTAPQKYLEEGKDLQMLSCKTTYCFHKNVKSEDTAICSTHLSQGKGSSVPSTVYQAGMLDRDVEGGSGAGCDMRDTDIYKRQKIGDGIGCSMTFDSAMKEIHITKKTSGQTDDLTKTVAEVLSQNNELYLNNPESFTCQRVQAYLGKINISCARTYMPWIPKRTCPTLKVAGSIDATAKNNSECATVDQNQPGSSNNQIKKVMQSTLTKKQDGECILSKRNGNSNHRTMLSELDRKEIKSALLSFSTGGQSGSGFCTMDSPSASSLLDNAVSNSSMSTPSPSTLGLSDREIGSFTNYGSSNFLAEPSSCSPSLCPLKKTKVPFLSEETQMSSCCSPFSASAYMSDSCDSSLLPQEQYKSNEEIPTTQSPSKLKPWHRTSPLKHNIYCSKKNSLWCTFPKKHCDETYSDVRSPVISPRSHLCRRSFSCHSTDSLDNDNHNSKDYDKHIDEELDLSSSLKRKPSSPKDDDDDDDDGNEEESQNNTDCEDNVEHGNQSSAQDPLYPTIKRRLTSSVLTEPRSSPSSDEDDGAVFTNGSDIAGSGSVEIKKDPTDDSQCGILNEFTAYQQDILIVDVIQDDPELFHNLHKPSLLKLGHTRVPETSKCKSPSVIKKMLSRTDETSGKLEQRVIPVIGDFLCGSPDSTEENDRRPWRPRMNTTTTEDKQTQNVQVPQSDVNNNDVDGGLVKSCRKQPASSPQSIIPIMPIGNGPWVPKSGNVIDSKPQTSHVYCRQYFSESLTCGFKKCHFKHLPMDGDEKFCVETVERFTKNPVCLQKAAAVFIRYYQKNPVGVYFSVPVLQSLLWALLKAAMVSDVFTVLSVSLGHNIMPNHEFLLALYNFVREKSLMVLAPELIQLTFKMVSAGLELGLDCLDCVKNIPVSQQSVHLNSPVSVSATQKLSTITPFPEYMDLALAIVEIELCSKQENWRQLGEVFTSICNFSQHPQQIEKISSRIAITLLSESKDKLSLPFVAFAETVYQSEGEDSPVMGFVGRIGVSLMLRYHKTHQWFKGQKVVEVLSLSKVKYSMLKGLFGNEDGTSRCSLITVATELFLWSGNVEGALQTLRENEWFVSSRSWPCEASDLEGRTHVLTRLTEKTSLRDTLEVLCNLPGIKEPNTLIDISRYTHLFNSHLQVCVERQMLPLAAETVYFMFSKNLAVDHTALQILLHKLGKQNLWLRAREVFRQSVSVGYYPGVMAPPGFMSLIVPCRLSEVELALTFEMFITVNAPVIVHPSANSAASLSITLKRTQICESDYLSSGSRVLSAACILQPKLVVQYTAVNSSQEQVFTLDISSARRWLRHNHLWANEVWAH